MRRVHGVRECKERSFFQGRLAAARTRAYSGLSIDRQGYVQAGCRANHRERACKQAPLRRNKHVFTILALAVALSWGLNPAEAALQDTGSPISGSPAVGSPEVASSEALPPEMFRNDPERSGEASGPGPIDIDGIEELWSFEAGGDVESSPAVVDGTVYFGSGDRFIYAIDVQTRDI